MARSTPVPWLSGRTNGCTAPSIVIYNVQICTYSESADKFNKSLSMQLGTMVLLYTWRVEHLSTWTLITICYYTHADPISTNASSTTIILAVSVPSGVVVIVILLIVMAICVIALRRKRETLKGSGSSNRGILRFEIRSAWESDINC